MKTTFATPNASEVPDNRLVLLVDPLNPSLNHVIDSTLAEKMVLGRYAKWAGADRVLTDRGKINIRKARLKKSKPLPPLRGCSAIMSPRHPKHGPDSGFYRSYLEALCAGNDKRRNAVVEVLAGWREK